MTGFFERRSNTTTKKEQKMEKFYTIAEACRLLSIGRTTLYELIASGAIPAKKIRRATRISGEGIDRFIKECPPVTRKRTPKKSPKTEEAPPQTPQEGSKKDSTGGTDGEK
jgi:excisionase family DNA binding protein